MLVVEHTAPGNGAQDQWKLTPGFTLNYGVRVNHILDDGRKVGHSEIEGKLLEISGRTADDLFAPREERLATAYRERARKVAFAEPQPGPGGPIAAE